ncbi:uncharacterized protein V1510DRAFT_402383 [Dipodascopsis tothii]|uniref:uncharacterized protein n=1 Tax=Dipodascopsis tothii TaxID=44089 RepID=UPI0034CE0F57
MDAVASQDSAASQPRTSDAEFYLGRLAESIRRERDGRTAERRVWSEQKKGLESELRHWKSRAGDAPVAAAAALAAAAADAGADAPRPAAADDLAAYYRRLYEFYRARAEEERPEPAALETLRTENAELRAQVAQLVDRRTKDMEVVKQWQLELQKRDDYIAALKDRQRRPGALTGVVARRPDVAGADGGRGGPAGAAVAAAAGAAEPAAEPAAAVKAEPASPRVKSEPDTSEHDRRPLQEAPAAALNRRRPGSVRIKGGRVVGRDDVARENKGRNRYSRSVEKPAGEREWDLGDFVVNPEFSGGVDYAHTEVVRGKDRQCLHGHDCRSCTDFYRLAGDGGAGEQAPSWNGGGTRRGAVAEASRHRATWQRPPSPVGFWRSDFPSTQEAAAEKAEARERHRAAVAERLREALRNGRYLFRDARFRPMAPAEPAPEW